MLSNSAPPRSDELDEAERREEPSNDDERRWSARAREHKAAARACDYRQETETEIPYAGFHCASLRSRPWTRSAYLPPAEASLNISNICVALWRAGVEWATIPTEGIDAVGRQADRAPAELEHLRALLEAYMAKHGLRSTDQRRLIVETFFRSGNHVSIEELLARVRSKDPGVGYATVYRTLRLLTECGVANERRFGDGPTRYELADDASHHDHLICIECRDITEFEEPRIEELQERVARKYGFELRTHKHELYGICPRCLARRRDGN